MEEKGFVDVETISTLAVQLLGGHLTESQKHYIQATSDEKTEEGMVDGSICILIQKYDIFVLHIKQ